MMEFVNYILDWLRSLFWKEEMELTLVGLQNSGKTTFVDLIAVSICGHYGFVLQQLLELTNVVFIFFAVWTVFGRHDTDGGI